MFLSIAVAASRLISGVILGCFILICPLWDLQHVWTTGSTSVIFYMIVSRGDESSRVLQVGLTCLGKHQKIESREIILCVQHFVLWKSWPSFMNDADRSEI